MAGGHIRAIAPLLIVAMLVGTRMVAAPAPTVASPAPKATPCPRPLDPIAIQSVWISEDPIVAGTTVSGIVVATCNVASVTAQVGTYRVELPKRSPGIFEKSIGVPRLVWPGHFTLVVTAIRTDGATVQKKLPIELRWKR